MSAPNPNTVHPIAGYDKEIYVKPTIKNPNIIVGDFTYIADSEFGSHVTHHYDFVGDMLFKATPSSVRTVSSAATWNPTRSWSGIQPKHSATDSTKN